MAATLSKLNGLAKLFGQYYGNHRKVISRLIYITLILSLINRARISIDEQKKSVESSSNARKSTRVAVDRVFVQRLLRLIKILFPGGVRSKEFGLLFTYTVFLVIRSLLSLYVATLDGKLVSYLIKGKGRDFLLGIAWWMVVSVPATVTNSILQYLQGLLALRYRSRLNDYILKQYLPDSDNPMYYAIHNLDDRIRNADQLITVDVQRFAKYFAKLYSNLAKPTFDMILYSWQLSRNVGGEGLFIMGILTQLSAYGLRMLTPPFGKYVSEETQLEGDFRFHHSRLIEHNEEIALYGGHDIERNMLDTGYFTLIKHVNRILKGRLRYGFIEDFTIKYLWGGLGLILCAVPIFIRIPGAAIGAGDRTQSFVTNRRLLLSGSDAFGRIMFSYKEIAQLAGYTARVCSLLDVMQDISNGDYQKMFITGKGEETLDGSDGSQLSSLSEARGEVSLGPDIEFINVPIISPSGDVLVASLSFKVKQGQHLLIVGPNGCGKSSLFRILGGLWPVQGGHVIKPASHHIFYIPQRPYLSRGTLRQQIIYPNTELENTLSDEDLLDILAAAEIDDIVEASGGFDVEREWKEDLSMGVQQRIAMARLFYHKPTYAILDECTSSVPLSTEAVMYQHAKDLGISLLTVSHRTSLWKYHNLILQFDGLGGYVFTNLDAEKRLKLEEERFRLELLLKSIPEVEERLSMLRSIVDVEPQPA